MIVVVVVFDFLILLIDGSAKGVVVSGNNEIQMDKRKTNCIIMNDFVFDLIF
jgi:hypothetical protein